MKFLRDVTFKVQINLKKKTIPNIMHSEQQEALFLLKLVMILFCLPLVFNNDPSCLKSKLSCLSVQLFVHTNKQNRFVNSIVNIKI